MTTCTYNARMLASDAIIEDLTKQARKIKYDVIGLIETRRRHPLNAVYETGEELFLGTCDSRGVDGVGVLVDSMAKNIYRFEQLGPRKTAKELHIGAHGLQWNEQGERLSAYLRLS
ncbi:hypothetical protein RB195_010963 [Necator americanus]|uniref:Uncharacterized protein n=1 Tax=Necator americanus TaxID=51031 RepID=A0ABR1D0I6_NECAM